MTRSGPSALQPGQEGWLQRAADGPMQGQLLRGIPTGADRRSPESWPRSRPPARCALAGRLQAAPTADSSQGRLCRRSIRAPGQRGRTGPAPGPAWRGSVPGRRRGRRGFRVAAARPGTRRPRARPRPGGRPHTAHGDATGSASSPSHAATHSAGTPRNWLTRWQLTKCLLRHRPEAVPRRRTAFPHGGISDGDSTPTADWPGPSRRLLAGCGPSSGTGRAWALPGCQPASIRNPSACRPGCAGASRLSYSAPGSRGRYRGCTGLPGGCPRHVRGD